MEEKTISKSTIKYLQTHEPEFLKSYMVLLSFFNKMNEYNPKRWKDGRILLTPKPNPNDSKTSEREVGSSQLPDNGHEQHDENVSEK